MVELRQVPNLEPNKKTKGLGVKELSHGTGAGIYEALQAVAIAS